MIETLFEESIKNHIIYSIFTQRREDMSFIYCMYTEFDPFFWSLCMSFKND